MGVTHTQIDPSGFADEAIGHEGLRRVYRAWAALPRPAGIPAKADLDPTAIRGPLSHVALAEIETPFRVRYRLVGTGLVRLWGREVTNRYVDEVYPGSLARELMVDYRRVVETRQPLYTERIFNLLVKKLGYYRLMLPMTWKGSGADIVMLGIFPLDADFVAAEQWRELDEAQAYLASFPIEPLGKGEHGQAA